MNLDKEEILLQRAKDLAKKKEIIEAKLLQLDIVEFYLSNEKYGIESLFIREILPLKDLTPLPFTPPFLMGIINVRGQILPVMDLKFFFDLPAKGIHDFQKVIIVSYNSMETCIIADSIIAAKSIPLTSIQPAPPTLKGIQAEYIKGVTKEFLIILDIEKILTDKKIIIHDEVT
ncbi:MAG: chemotaxis protein CheW [Desulfobacterales bacterium]|nr:chemotaxis protein CheW [Desulfobacterales bacterium]